MGRGAWGMGRQVDKGKITLNNFQLPTTNYQSPMPNAPCPMPHAHSIKQFALTVVG
ncbi:MAG: hypothetical protein AAF630_21420 [Cyanobacteria bacterium P01_C01_bin.38]